MREMLTIILHSNLHRRAKMSKNSEKDIWVRVKDEAGNAFICPLNALKDQNLATDQELENCVDDI